MADIPGHHLGHARLHRVALGGHNQVSTHGGDLLDSRALASLPQKGHLTMQGVQYDTQERCQACEKGKQKKTSLTHEYVPPPPPSGTSS